MANHIRKYDYESFFQAIVNYKRANGGLSPSVRELCALTGVRSTSAANFIMMKLHQAGRINLVGFGQARAIRIPGERWEWEPAAQDRA